MRTRAKVTQKRKSKVAQLGRDTLLLDTLTILAIAVAWLAIIGLLGFLLIEC